MGPATEQLIRDYLNRLTVAARGRLGPDDVRALVDRTRDFIEHQAGAAGPPTTLEVGSLLYRLGDPAALVEQERQRLADVGAELPEPLPVRKPMARVLRRDFGKPRGASWHLPVVPGGRADLQFMLIHSTGATGAAEGSSNGAAGDATAGNGTRADSHASTPYVPAQPGERDWFFRALGGRSAPDQTGPAAVDVEGDETAEAGDLASTTVSPDWQLTTPRDPVVRRQARRVLAAVAAWFRRMPREASAVVLLGLGGASYPPLWLLGAAVALLPSRVWDGRDKWLGLALPVLLTIIAASLGVTVGGQVSVAHSLHEGWVFGVAGSRLAAALGAAYLCWRTVHGRRPPMVPPWNRPRKVH
jgi:hypothetical protein